MQTNFNLENFINTYVTKRSKSLLDDDFLKYNTELNSRINGKNVLVIGGAGSLVNKDIPDWTIASGRPAKVIKEIPKRS